MSQTIREAVAAKIAASGPSILEQVADALAEEVIGKRVKQVHAAMTELDNIARDLKKLKPDQVAYDESGTVQNSFFSKKVIDDRKKLSEREAKIQKALAKALENNEWGDMGNLGGSGAKPDGESS